jgi:hypothetical protein
MACDDKNDQDPQMEMFVKKNSSKLSKIEGALQCMCKVGTMLNENLHL